MQNSAAPPVGASGQYHALDGLRGLAAVFVVFWHLRDYLAPFSVSSAYLAVDLFFLMSGFVISHAYQGRLGAGLGAGRFIVLRIIRVYPLYLAGTALTLAGVALGVASEAASPWHWAMLARAAPLALLMLPRWPGGGIPPWLYPFNYPAWSLASELLANAAYAACAGLRRGWMLWALALAAGAGLVAVVVTAGSLNGGALWALGWVGLVRVGFSFFFGVVMERCHAAGRLPAVRFPLLLVLAVVGAALYADPGAAWRPLYDLGAVLVLFPLVVWLCVVNQPRFALGLYRFFGTASYPLYAIHVPVMFLLGKGLAHLPPALFAPWRVWIGFGMIAPLLALSWGLAVSYDKAVRGWLVRRLG